MGYELTDSHAHKLKKEKINGFPLSEAQGLGSVGSHCETLL